MAALVCDLCGGKLVMGSGGIATCDSCGMEHSAHRMKEKVQEIKGVVQTDSSHLIANYMGMAANAIDAGNNAEAEAYCNKIIEVDPTNYMAWMLKGEAAAWQSTLANSRLNEGVNAFAKGIDFAPEDEKEQVIERASEQIRKLCIAIVNLQTERFQKWPDEEETSALISLLTNVINTVSNFISQTGIRVEVSKIMNPVANSIDNSIIEAYTQIILPQYKSDRYPYPDRDDWEKYIQRISYCIKLIDLTLTICDENDYENCITRYNNRIYLNKQAIESCAYDSEYTDFHEDLGKEWVRKTEAIIRQNGGIPDAAHSRYYYSCRELTDTAKGARRLLIRLDEAKINQIKEAQAEREAAEKAERERIAREEAQRRFDEYWAAHAEEKETLQAEQEGLNSEINNLNAKLNDQVAALNKEIAAIPGGAEIANIDERINKLTSDKNALGFFKGKEKKALQEQIDQLVSEKTAIQSRMAAAKKELEAKFAAAKADVQKKIAPMQSRVTAINNELTKAR